MEAGQQSLPVIPASGIVYLFSDRFVRSFDLNPVEEEARVYEVGEEVPCSDKLVDARALAQELVTVALIELDRLGYINLTLLTPDGVEAENAVADELAVRITQLRPSSGTHGLEQALLDAITTLETQNSVHEVTWRAIGEEDAFPGDFIIKYVQAGLQKTDVYDVQLRPGGWFKRLVAGATVRVINCERVAELQGRIPLVKKLLADFRKDDPALDATLRQQVASAIRSRFVASIDGQPQPDEID